MTKRKKKAPAEPRKPLNEPAPRTDPASWGPPQEVYRYIEGPVRPVFEKKPRGPQAGYFAYLIDNGQITPEQKEAGEEIAEVFLALVGGLLSSRAQQYERVDRGMKSDWPERIAVAYGMRYRPWANEMSVWRVNRKQPSYDIVIDAVVECRSLRGIAASRRMGRNRVKEVLIDALQEYCRIAGWERKPARIRVG